MKKIFVMSLISQLLILLIFINPITATSESEKYGGIYKSGETRSSRVFGYPPLIQFGARRAEQPALESLFFFDAVGNVMPRLAKGYEVSSDGKSVNIFLREGVKFHDGTDCDAEAIKWNIEEHARANVIILPSVASVDAVDKYTVRLNLKNYSNYIFYDLVLMGVISPTAVKKHGVEWAYTNPVGTGPMKVESFQREVSLKYVKFDEYWQKGKPYLDAVEYHYISDPISQEMALRSGAIHSMQHMGLPLKNVPLLKKAGYNIKRTIMGAFGLYPDSKDPDSPFHDKKVREAVAYAIDNKAITDALGHGYLDPATQIEHPSRPLGFNPNLKGREHNPDKAKQLLAEAGYPNGLKTNIITYTGSNVDAVTAIKAYLAKVGIDAKIDIFDFAKYMELYNTGWKGLFFWFTASEPNALDALMQNFHSSTSFNSSVNKTKEINEMLEDADSERDRVKLKEKIQKIVKYISDEVVCIPIYFNYHIIIENPKLHDTGNYDDEATFKVYWTPENAWLSK